LFDTFILGHNQLPITGFFAVKHPEKAVKNCILAEKEGK
jgi:hypothetical protein